MENMHNQFKKNSEYLTQELINRGIISHDNKNKIMKNIFNTINDNYYPYSTYYPKNNNGTFNKVFHPSTITPNDYDRFVPIYMINGHKIDLSNQPSFLQKFLQNIIRSEDDLEISATKKNLSLLEILAGKDLGEDNTSIPISLIFDHYQKPRKDELLYSRTYLITPNSNTEKNMEAIKNWEDYVTSKKLKSLNSTK